MKRIRGTAVRTPEMLAAYRRFKENAPDGCPICRAEPIEEYTYWRLIPNDFPYDAVTDRHCMLVPKRHIGRFDDMSDEEQAEYYTLIDTLEEFDALLRNFSRYQTIPEHFHVHLIVYKPAYEEEY